MINKELLQTCSVIINYLNTKINKSFKATTNKTQIMISDRINENYTIEDFKRVIDCKCEEWINTKFEKYLKPNTLFRKDKFEEYLQQSYIKNENKIIENEKFKIEGYEGMLNHLVTMKYSDYLLTEHWIHFKEEALKFFSNKCQLCNSENNLVIHHKTYVNRGRETFNDVICLCKECHSKIHNK